MANPKTSIQHKIKFEEPYLPPGITIETTVVGLHGTQLAVQAGMAACREVHQQGEALRKQAQENAR